MFIGHFGVGFGAKSLNPGASLGTLFLAAQFVDLLWPSLLLLGVENVSIVPGATQFTPLEFTNYPISHSLLLTIVWGAVIGGVYGWIRKRLRGAIVIGLCVLSHWFLDLIVHAPDLPLYPGDSPRVGLGLWDSIMGTLIVEGLIFGLGIYMYARVTQARDRIGVYALWGLVAFLAAIHFANVLGPPPPNSTAVAWVGQAQWLLVVWAYWLDKHRRLKVSGAVSL